ncbi:MAG: plasma-membrane proton-efflux P-type ATPase [Candidatus Micrarchaeales archaeon]|nr:plasma-membrane proton-efflux P-type ATPase [Candidatus Micrarchaeales archaeon]
MKGDYERMSADDALSELGSSRSGLSEGEARSRLLRYGYNEVLEKRESRILKLLRKFYGPIPLILEAVVLISFLVQDYRNAYIILALLVVNAFVGFAEERKADNSVELLKKRLTVSARVLRNARWESIQSRLLVPGDIIRIRMGDIVPADAKVIDADYLDVDQSVLTGESMPIAKKRNAIVYSGSVVKRGEAKCVVVTTGYSTFYGRTTELVQTAKPKTHLDKMILGIVKSLIAIDAVVVVVLFLFSYFALHSDPLVILTFLLVVLIASVPVSLPAAFTVSMAVGTERLAKKSILVTKLESIEEAASLDVVCLDKTGTLTKNELEVEEIVPLFGSSEKAVLRAAAFASRESDKDPIDIAVLKRARNAGALPAHYEYESFAPFQPATKMSSAVVLSGSEKTRAAKGAATVIARMCRLTARQRAELDTMVASLSLRKFRTIAVAENSGNGKRYRLLGLIALYDEPRPGAARLIKELGSLGVRVKMLTGDNKAIAAEVAKEVGIKGRIADFESLRKRSGREFNREVEEADVFAGIYPEDKYLIVRSLQAAGHRVGMTGDGVNDAPALKQAEVGIAVENATDVAKSVAALVLTKNGIDVIVDSIKESRRISERMITYTMAKVTRAVQILFFIMAAFFILGTFPILAFELVLLLFTNDIANITLATDNVGYSKRPDVWNIKALVVSSAALGSVLLLASLFVIPLSAYLLVPIAGLQTLVLVMLTYMDKLVVFSLRERKHMWDSRPSGYLVLSSIASAAFVVAIAYFGILVQGVSAVAILLVLALSTALILAFDYVKYFIFGRFGMEQARQRA